MNKKYVPIIVALVVVLGLVSVLVFSNKGGNTAEDKQDLNQLPNTAVIPTVDSSVIVKLEPLDGNKHEVVLSIENMPKDTKNIEYELSYNTETSGLQGNAGGPVDVKEDEVFERQLLLGTESSGVPTYHKVVGPLKVVIKFNGTYGAKSFEKDFDL